MRESRTSGSERGEGEQSPLSTYPFEWDYVLGGNTTGLFPEETHYEVDGNTLLEVIFRHTGGNKFEPVYGDNWEIENVSEMQRFVGSRTFTFDQGTGHFKATVNEKLTAKYGLLIVDLVELR